MMTTTTMDYGIEMKYVQCVCTFEMRYSTGLLVFVFYHSQRDEVQIPRNEKGKK